MTRSGVSRRRCGAGRRRRRRRRPRTRSAPRPVRVSRFWRCSATSAGPAEARTRTVGDREPEGAPGLTEPNRSRALARSHSGVPGSSGQTAATASTAARRTSACWSVARTCSQPSRSGWPFWCVTTTRIAVARTSGSRSCSTRVRSWPGRPAGRSPRRSARSPAVEPVHGELPLPGSVGQGRQGQIEPGRQRDDGAARLQVLPPGEEPASEAGGAGPLRTEAGERGQRRLRGRRFVTPAMRRVARITFRASAGRGEVAARCRFGGRDRLSGPAVTHSPPPSTTTSMDR